MMTGLHPGNPTIADQAVVEAGRKAAALPENQVVTVKFMKHRKAQEFFPVLSYVILWKDLQ